ncbi:hypothetical protein B5G20_06425 [Collinsella sp. An7]|uniref:hypothetical protein n=1 Tax=Collinsella sp. An7 TaxID=1965651 RepID=UPI000B379377|nr:hypothetical protein [Collinsella sp. An7]OUN47021.1 hypothetical protein B5G20_06425 [Collinsella sp. An7]
MRAVPAILSVFCLSAVLLTGCSQGASAGSTPSEGSTLAAVEEETSEPAMENWTESAFYERPVTEVISDLELLSFEVADAYYDGSEEYGYSYFYITLTGELNQPLVEGASEYLQISLTIDHPVFTSDSEQTLEALDPATIVTGVDAMMYHPEVDPSEWEGLAQQAIDAFGLEPMTSSSTDVSPFDENRMLGNYTGPSTFNGQEAEYMIIISSSREGGDLPEPDKPLFIDVSLFFIAATE